MLIAGGSLTNALTAVMLSILLPWPPDPVTHRVLTPVLLIQAGYAILNLVVVIGPGRRGTTDERLFRAALRQPPMATDHLLAPLHKARVTDRMPDPPPSRRPCSLMWSCMRW